MNAVAVISALVGAVLGGGGSAVIVNAIARRRLTRAEAADALTDSAIELLRTVKADAREDMAAMRSELSDARREAAETRREASETRQRIREATIEAEALRDYLTRVVTAIHDPTMTMERLRLLVGTGPPPNSSRAPVPL